MLSMTLILQLGINGLLMGGIYALAAIGLTLIFGVMGIVNFAHGALMMLGMYASYWFFTFLGIDPYLSLILVVPCFFIVGGLIQKYIIHHTLGAPPINQFLITVGIMLFIENAVLFLFSPDFRAVRVEYFGAIISIGELIISLLRLVAFVIAVGLTGALYLFLKKTDSGRALRAVAANKEAAQLMGINLNYVYLMAFGIGVACVGAAGTIVSPLFGIFPHVGHLFLLMAFVVVILGGLGSFVGAFLGGLIIGAVESLCTLFMPGSTKEAFVFSIFILVLLFRPSGLFGRGE
jgi:branched-chain amino acid transport system permease protein